jgi:hypothetical protein
MTQRQRKFAGTIALFVLVAVYAILAMAVAAVMQIHDASRISEALYYVIAGWLWVLPAGLLIKWMLRPD